MSEGAFLFWPFVVLMIAAGSGGLIVGVVFIAVAARSRSTRKALFGLAIGLSGALAVAPALIILLDQFFGFRLPRWAFAYGWPLGLASVAVLFAWAWRIGPHARTPKIRLTRR